RAPRVPPPRPRHPRRRRPAPQGGAGPRRGGAAHARGPRRLLRRRAEADERRAGRAAQGVGGGAARPRARPRRHRRPARRHRADRRRADGGAEVPRLTGGGPAPALVHREEQMNQATAPAPTSDAPSRDDLPVLDAQLSVEGMTCASCVARVERALGKLDGVVEANVNLATERATVRYRPGLAPELLEEAVRKAGYEVRRVDDERRLEDAEREARQAALSRLERDLIVAAAFTLPLFLMEMGAMLVPPLHDRLATWLPMTTRAYVMFALASVVQLGPGLRFYRLGVPALLRGAPDMNSLVVLGTTAAYGYSVVATFAPHWLPAGTAPVYYEASAVIVTLILLGRWFEARAKGRTGEAIRALMALQPPTARVVRNAAEVEVKVEEVRRGDILVVRPGERLPVDGVVVEGSS